ncbi:rod-binding protein [Geotalea uraniireducens]|uniref:Rod binding protein-like protein n=1 Tax=Geotalea uraniireducens (strain Rf4) TaxID=351605 RepID=A5G8X7_GEOUR|nr:rod-binding protein [Geotalea uraniireducens]ABQ28245.1 Rod binding protein-like protein [Geotalea uraniireducens Rf4]
MDVSTTPVTAMPVEDVKLRQSLKFQPQSAEKEKAAAKKVAREFEVMFVGMMLKSMRETVGKDKLTGGGHGEEVYQSLLDQEYAKGVVDSGGVGLARMIEKQLVRQDKKVEPENGGLKNVY